MIRFVRSIALLILLAIPVLTVAAPKTVAQKYAGYFVVEKGKSGPLWYIPPHKPNPKRYCITTACDPVAGPDKNPCFFKDASRQDLDRIPRAKDRARSVVKSVLGRILPDVVNETEAWYVDPRTSRRYPIGGQTAAALRVMRSRARLVTSAELKKIPVGLPCPKTPVQPKPQTLTLRVETLGCNAARLQWNAIDSVDAYTIVRNGAPLVTVTKNLTAYDDIGVAEASAFSYVVRGVNTRGTVVASQSAEFASGHCAPLPPPIQQAQSQNGTLERPRITSVALPACNTLQVRWSGVSGATAYKIFRNGVAIADVAKDATMFTDPNLAENTEYRYAVSAVNDKSLSDPSDDRSWRTTICPKQAIQPPTRPTLTQVQPLSCSILRLSWQDVPDDEGYELFRDSRFIATLAPNATQHADVSLQERTTYSYMLRSFKTVNGQKITSQVSTSLGGTTDTCSTNQNLVIQPPPPPQPIEGSLPSTQQSSAGQQPLPPPPPTQQNVTTAACAGVGGTTCRVGEICPSRWRDVTGDNRCCATTCQTYSTASLCNHNSICEPKETDACGDCQCRGGTICGGLCYGITPDDATCVGSTLVHTDATKTLASIPYCADTNCASQYAACLLPGPCLLNTVPIKVTLDLPSTLEVGEWTNGSIEFLNTGTTKYTNHLYFELRGIEMEASIKGSVLPFPTDWYLGEYKPNTPVRYSIRARTQILTDGWTATHQMKRATIGMRFETTGATIDKAFVGVERATAQTCGGYTWNLPGRCMGTVYYPGASCTSGDTCFGRVPGFKTYPATQKAKGTFNTLFLTVDLNPTQQSQFPGSTLLGFGNEVRDFYRREAERIVGKPMVDFTFTFGGSMQWSVPEFQFVFLQGKQTIREYVASKLGMSLAPYQFVIMAVPTIPTQASVGEANGLYLGDGMIVLRAATESMHAANMAHELSHGFGCQDPWMGGANRYFLCNERRVNNLLCGAETFAPEVVWFKRVTEGYYNLSHRRLDDCAAELGWGDVDNDGIVDVEDPSI